MSSATWDLKVPKFVADQFLRHRTAKYWKVNAFSFRYSDGVSPGRQVDPEDPGIQWYVPAALPTPEAIAVDCHGRESVRLYRALLQNGVKSEDARAVLPVNIYVRIRIQIDMNNALHFFRLRCAKDAQSETRAYAKVMREQILEFFPNLFRAEHILAHAPFRRGAKFALSTLAKDCLKRIALLEGAVAESNNLHERTALSWQDKQVLAERGRKAQDRISVERDFLKRIDALMAEEPLDPEAEDV